MRILLLGKFGQLGRAFLALEDGCIEKMWSFSHQDLDVCDSAQITQKLERYKPDVLINCTAFTDVPAAETNSERAYAVNAQAIESLSQICRQSNTKLVHYSTDYVFDGKKDEPYLESDPTNPLNEYGRSKLAGEDAIRSNPGPWLLFRTSWVYGEGSQNFIHKFQTWASQNDELRIVDDEISIPTAATDIAKFTLQALKSDLNGLYHLTASGTASRYEYATELKRLLPSIHCHLHPAKSQEFKTNVDRPLYSVLDNRKLSRDLKQSFPHWREALRRTLRTNGRVQC